MTGRVLYVGGGPDDGGLGSTDGDLVVELAEDGVDAIKRLSSGSSMVDCVVVRSTLPDLSLDAFLRRVERASPGAATVVVGPPPTDPEAAAAITDVDAYVPSGLEAALPDRIRGVLQDRRIDRAVHRHGRLTEVVAGLAVSVAEAPDRDAIERAVHERLMADGVYSHVWVARVTEDDAFEVTVPAAGPMTEADLRDVAGQEGPSLASRALRHGQVVSTDTAAPTRSTSAAVGASTAGEGSGSAGLRSAFVPFVNEGRVRGLALVSTPLPDALDATERDLLADLGTVVGHGLAAVASTDGEGAPDLADGMGTLVHELRNPLGIARSHLDIARDDGDERSFDHVESALERMLDTVDRVAAGVGAGGAVDEREVDLASLARDAWEPLSTASATLEVVGTATFPADRDLALRLLTNLFQNAIDHGGEDVTVRVGPTPGGFFVADDGPGIDPADRESVFARGYTTAEDGLGLGLSIVQGVVDAHGWSLSVTDADGGGARFVVADVNSIETDAMEGNEPA